MTHQSSWMYLCFGVVLWILWKHLFGSGFCVSCGSPRIYSSPSANYGYVSITWEQLPRNIGCLTAAFETAILYSSSVTPPTRAFTEFYGIMFTYLGVFYSVLLILDCQMFALVCVYFIINGVSYLHSPWANRIRNWTANRQYSIYFELFTIF